MDFGGQRFDVDHLVEYVETAVAHGFDAVSVNEELRRFGEQAIPAFRD